MSYQYKIGYTQGTFDMFHIGHLNLLRNAKALCGKLIVGVNSDDLVYSYKNKRPIISQANRAEIISELRCVDDVIICSSLDKRKIWDTLKFDVIFIGDDWAGNERWKQTEFDLAQVGAQVVYLKHTDGISSSFLRFKEKDKIQDLNEK